MKIIKPEDLEIGQAWTRCCERDLDLIRTNQDINEIIILWDDIGIESVEVWDTELNALLELRERNISTGDNFDADVVWWSELITDAIQNDKNRYYGVAWEYESNTFRGTGLLEYANLQTYNDIMFIHNQIKKINNKFEVPDFYYRNMKTSTEVIIDISDLKLDDFKYTNEETITCRAHKLFYIESNFLANVNDTPHP